MNEDASRGLRPVPGVGGLPPVSRPTENVDDTVRRYRRWRHRRKAAARLRDTKQALSRDKDTDDVVAFARTWAPYGGAPTSEIFVRFGMSRSRFVDRLWQVVPGVTRDPAIVRELAAVYPRHAQDN
ncbi:hypothetical protein RW1_022_01310 [Rhodococcus wratislaviensis NBRC 100605]|uniref:DUF3263 domain-containing protein n=1 Tax=Rhodococcus wratislaviensis NBRC 100605 TaxID=1219028 RepID=X0Q4W0_RHOWR|nr:hypothetical protein RW1_022_01310 [Rhodococcus wratislaviensis NBRC 100605]